MLLDRFTSVFGLNARIAPVTLVPRRPTWLEDRRRDCTIDRLSESEIRLNARNAWKSREFGAVDSLKIFNVASQNYQEVTVTVQ